MLDLFARTGARATFFLVGREAEKPHNRDVLRRVVDEGHEAANHSMTHSTNFPRFGSVAKAYEIDESHKAIEEATGSEPVGFRAPVFGLDPMTLDLLEERGYLYDSSIFPSALSVLRYWVSRMRFLQSSGRSLAGSPLLHFAPKEPYHPDQKALWRKGDRSIWEIPLGVLPGLNLPFYGSFLHWAGMGYFRTAFSLTARRSSHLAVQCQPMEVMTVGEDGVDPRMARFPGLRKPIAEKERFIQACLERIGEVYELLPGREFLRRAGHLREKA